MRKSTSVLMPGAARRNTLPPLPPSPPSGPPRGTNFSRRKLVLPRPPLPALTFSRASSTNFIWRNKNPGLRRGFAITHASRSASGRLGLRGLDADEQLLLGPLLLEADLACDLGKQR